ncbi:MAG: N-acetyl-gamma-glutamyl-phosphate reductase [Anaeromicrobium sp.]|jgi:N-acetyl-gamma-glutamyl-phosphate reductase|uniref:N-acetyl-gamma-glutamyl-phosphate reductase n=1 Tax=Anaeromicrobium sp. TaxID=1929132 RepID=UPI0025E7EBEB|nr:N-acetyl-gamma-glutamyl-phosphate reductase [Anaeromicrobium sp.]MCT4596009.1 N-acetyl-gamma-glutamyl-phosphate reductase [Anaeromicrobium sp.]
MIKVGIIGATGYVGQELIRILNNHREAKIEFITSSSYEGEEYNSIYLNYNNIFSHVCEEENINELIKRVDLLFMALPHGMTHRKIDEEILKKVKVIDLGADFRFHNIDTYEEHYKVNHENKKLNKKAVYGLCEVYKDEIKKSSLIGNPGCYTTCSILSLAPLVKNKLIDLNNIIIDAKSGISGMGRNLNLKAHYTQSNESIEAYSMFNHRHTPEIEEKLSEIGESKVNVIFTPHLIPMNRGILTTSYCKLTEHVDYDHIKKLYLDYYEDSPFIRILTENISPSTKWVKGSNYVDMNFFVKDDRLIVISALDNLVKGAAGQAVQNMNLIFNMDETTGLKMVPIFTA